MNTTKQHEKQEFQENQELLNHRKQNQNEPACEWFTCWLIFSEKKQPLAALSCEKCDKNLWSFK